MTNKGTAWLVADLSLPFSVLVGLMTSFRLTDAHCYDPNEESRIRRVVSAVGEARFNKQISRLTDTLCDKIQQRISRQRRDKVLSAGSGSGSAGLVMSAGPAVAAVVLVTFGAVSEDG